MNGSTATLARSGAASSYARPRATTTTAMMTAAAAADASQRRGALRGVGDEAMEAEDCSLTTAANTGSSASLAGAGAAGAIGLAWRAAAGPATAATGPVPTPCGIN